MLKLAISLDVLYIQFAHIPTGADSGQHQSSMYVRKTNQLSGATQKTLNNHHSLFIILLYHLLTSTELYNHKTAEADYCYFAVNMRITIGQVL